jgi:hypothetical protein
MSIRAIMIGSILLSSCFTAAAEQACQRGQIPRTSENGSPTTVCVTVPSAAKVTRTWCDASDWDPASWFRCGAATKNFNGSNQTVCIGMVNWSSKERTGTTCAEFER